MMRVDTIIPIGILALGAYMISNLKSHDPNTNSQTEDQCRRDLYESKLQVKNLEVEKESLTTKLRKLQVQMNLSSK